MSGLLYPKVLSKNHNQGLKKTPLFSFENNLRFPTFHRNVGFASTDNHHRGMSRPITTVETNARPSTREGFRKLLESIRYELHRAFYSSGEDIDIAPLALTNPQEIQRHVVPLETIKPRRNIEIDDCTNIGFIDNRIEDFYSSKCKRDGDRARKSFETYLKLGLQPDPDVSNRIETEIVTNGNMDVDVGRTERSSTVSKVLRKKLPCDSQWMDKARQFLQSHRSSDNVELIMKFDIPINERKLSCLRPVTWLNDEIINFYMELLHEYDAALCGQNSTRKPSHFFNSFFISKLLENGQYSYKNVKRYISNPNLCNNNDLIITYIWTGGLKKSIYFHWIKYFVQLIFVIRIGH
jgi:hypothetical protein